MELLSDDFQENLDRLIVECLEMAVFGVLETLEQWLPWTQMMQRLL